MLFAKHDTGSFAKRVGLASQRLGLVEILVGFLRVLAHTVAFAVHQRGVHTAEHVALVACFHRVLERSTRIATHVAHAFDVDSKELHACNRIVCKQKEIRFFFKPYEFFG